MTPEKTKAACAAMRARVHEMTTEARELSVDEKHAAGRPPYHTDAHRHVLYMLDQIEAFADAGRMGKAFRWLGFAQGVVWMTGLASLEELKAMNMPDAPTPDTP